MLLLDTEPPYLAAPAGVALGVTLLPFDSVFVHVMNSVSNPPSLVLRRFASSLPRAVVGSG